MANLADQKRVILSDKADEAVEGLVINFGLEESDEAYAEKIRSGKNPNVTVLRNVIWQLALKTVTEKNAIAILQKESGLAPQKAADLVASLKTNILPFVEIVSEEELAKKAKEAAVQPVVKAAAGVKPALETKKALPIAETLLKPTLPKRAVPGDEDNDFLNIPPAKKPSVPSVPMEEKKMEQAPKKQSGPDAYREPVN